MSGFFKSGVLKAFLASALALNFSGTAHSAEDMYYLRNEIRETQAKYNKVHGDAEKARNFINGYGNMQQSLDKTYDELTALETKMRDLLQKNLIKSTIKLGIDTYGKVNLVLGFAQQSAKMIIVACACEIAGDQMQDSFSTPYSAAVKGLSDEARKLAPEMEEVQRTLALSMDEVKSEALKAGDKLGDVGAIYRKFQMILEAIEKAKKKIYELRKNLDKTLENVKNSLPQVEEEEKRLENRLRELTERLSRAYQELIDAELQPIIQQSKERSKIAVTPIPSGLTDENEIEKRKSEKINQLLSVLNQLQDEWSALSGRFSEAIKVPSYDGGSYNPLDYRISVMPIFNVLTEQEIKGMDMQYIKSEEEFFKRMIEQNTKSIKTINSFVGEFGSLESSARDRTTPILAELAGLGAQGDYNVSGFLYAVASTQLTLKEQAKTLQEEIDNLNKNLPMLKTAFEKRVQEAKAFAQELTTASVAPVEAASMAAAKAAEAVKAARDLNYTQSGGFGNTLNNVRVKVSEMFAGGATTAEVREYINKQKTSLIDLYEKAAKIEHLVRLRENTRSQFESKFFSDPRMGLLREIVDRFPEEISKDPSVAYSDQYWQYMYGTAQDNIWEARNIAASCFNIADQMNEIMEYFAKIDEVNQKVRDAMNKEEYPKAMHDMPEIVAELNADRPFLNNWLKSYSSPDGKTPGMYKVLSRETQKAMDAANARYMAKEKEKSDAAAEEARKKEEEERKKREEEDMERFGYDIYNPRVNTYAVPNIPGDMVLVRNDLRSGAVELTGRITNLYNVSKILIAEDGRVFQEVPKKEDLFYSFRPVPEKRYEPVIKLVMASGEEKILPFFDGAQVLVYRDIDFNVLVAETVKKVADAYEAQNVNMFLDQISQEFLGNRTYMEEGVRFDFDMFTDIRLKIFINRIEKRAGMFVADTKWDKTQMVRKTGQQQRTSGQTVMMFVLEDGRMKIKNLRGNLIYATLSPEIAEASGLNQAVVEEIRVARDDRNPIQPGAGQTEEDGGLTTFASSLNSRTLTVVINSGFTEGVDLSSGTQVGSGAGDFDLEFVEMFFPSGSTKLQNVTGEYSYGSLVTAPDVVDGGGQAGPTGTLFLVQTNEGYFAKVYVVSAVENDPGVQSTVTIQFAVQTDGSRNLKTQ